MTTQTRIATLACEEEDEKDRLDIVTSACHFAQVMSRYRHKKMMLPTSNFLLALFLLATSQIRQQDAEALDMLLEKARIDSPKIRDGKGDGFCNTVYFIETKYDKVIVKNKSTTTMTICAYLLTLDKHVAKVFSDLALQRMYPPKKHSVDRIAEKAGIGPCVQATTENGILVDWIDGTVLQERDIHANDSASLMEAMASCVQKLHKFDISSDWHAPNMLWYSIEAMLSMCSKTTPLVTQLHSHYLSQREALSRVELRTVLGHGDLKPSNMMFDKSSTVLMIDFETSGAHFRGFDIAKIFRTKQPSPYTDRNRNAFLKEYLNDDESALDITLREAEVLTPMTVSNLRNLSFKVQANRSVSVARSCHFLCL